MSAKCRFDNCENTPFKDLDKCALHCDKNDYSTDWRSGLLSEFYKEFKAYVLNYLSEYNYAYKEIIEPQELERFFDDFYDSKTQEVLSNILFVPTFIIFPTRDGRDHFDYLKVLQLFGQIHFNYCKFYVGCLQLDKQELFFQDCEFYTSWSLQNYKILENVNNIIYQDCIFNNSVSASAGSESEPLVINNNQFDAFCKFNGSIEIYKAFLKVRCLT